MTGDQRVKADVLAAALPWLEDAAGALAARQRAFRLYQEEGDLRSAARVATRLGVEFSAHHAEFAVGDGWGIRELLTGDTIVFGSNHPCPEFIP